MKFSGFAVDYTRGRVNHKLWMLPVIVVLGIVLLSQRACSCRRREPEPAPAAEPATNAAAVAQVPSFDPGQRYIDEAVVAARQGDLVAARDKCHAILAESKNGAARAAAEDMLGRLHIELVASPRPMPEKVDYTIQKGDTMAVLAKKFGTTVELIRKANNIRGDVIRVDSRLRVLTGRFSIAISKTRNDMVVSMNGKFFKRYHVGTGQYSTTPTGTFHVVDKVSQPTWWRPDGKAVPFGHPDNVLGTRWLSLDVTGYGIHGTWEPGTIGKQASAGCVRLLNEDVEELFDLVPVGTEVTIAD